jgi:GntR family transcriptional regulator/MocR family aminotransferase
MERLAKCCFRRCLIERFPTPLPQRTLASFIEEGHFARHLRRLREFYGARLATSS